MEDSPVLSIDQVTSVADRIRELREGSEDERKTFFKDGGWYLVRAWIVDSLRSKETQLVLEIFNILLELPSNSVLGLLKCNAVKFLEAVNNDLEEMGEEDARLVCSQIAAKWQLMLEPQNNETVSEDEKLMPVTFVVNCKDGKAVVQPTFGKVWWKLSLNGQTTMVRIKEEWYMKLLEPDPSINNPDAVIPPASPPLLQDQNLNTPSSSSSPPEDSSPA